MIYFTIECLQHLGEDDTVYPNCEKQDYAPQGEPLYKIVEDFAYDGQKWLDMFVQALTKMSANGYSSEDLTPNFSLANTRK